jgi:hypothetical protein
VEGKRRDGLRPIGAQDGGKGGPSRLPENEKRDARDKMEIEAAEEEGGYSTSWPTRFS